MAFLFKSGKMASNVLDSMLTNAKAEKVINDGDLVVLGDVVKDEIYGNEEYDMYKADYPAAPTTDEICIVDYAGISEGLISGNNYKLGVKLYDLAVPVGEPMRIRRLALHDKFWLGEDNFAAQPTVGKYAIATASSGKHTPADDATAEGYTVKIIAKQGFTAGMSADKEMYLCEVIKLA